MYMLDTNICIYAIKIKIAAHAMSSDLILATNNTRKFSRVQGLKLEDWI